MTTSDRQRVVCSWSAPAVPLAGACRRGTGTELQPRDPPPRENPVTAGSLDRLVATERSGPARRLIQHPPHHRLGAHPAPSAPGEDVALDRASHISAATQRRLDLAVVVRTLGHLHRRTIVTGEDLVHQRSIAVPTRRIDGHSTDCAFVCCHGADGTPRGTVALSPTARAEAPEGLRSSSPQTAKGSVTARESIHFDRTARPPRSRLPLMQQCPTNSSRRSD